MAKPGKHIEVQEVIEIDSVTDGPAKGWTHTHGLYQFGRPELEIRNVPSLFVPDAARLLNEIADYMLNVTDRPVLAGQTMQLGKHYHFRFHTAEADDAAGYDTNHYRHPVLRIDGIDAACVKCCAPKASA